MLTLNGSTEFLTIAGGPKSRRIRIFEIEHDGGINRGPEFRISPVFPSVSNSGSPGLDFKGLWHIFFFGPVAPDRASEYLAKGDRYWLSLGLLNNIIATQNGTTYAKLLRFLRGGGIAYEKMVAKNGSLKSKASHFPSGTANRIRSWKTDPKHHEISHSLSELGHLLSTIATRAIPLRSELHDVIDDYTRQIAAIVSRAKAGSMISRARPTDKFKPAPSQGVATRERNPFQEDYFDAHADLQNINSGLSRFAAQLCVCIPPLENYECHYWAHSALGLGTAVLGLCSVVEHIYRAVATKDIPLRFAKLCEKNFPEGLSAAAKDAKVFDISSEDYTPEAPADAHDHPMVSLPFFSGRDGFNSNRYSVSAPIASIHGATNIRWSLSNITHELSHDIIQGILHQLVPGKTRKSAHREILEAITRNEDKTIGDYIRKRFLLTVPFFSPREEPQSENDGISTGRWERSGEMTQEQLADHIDSLLYHVRIDIEEIMVHAFDFIYFHKRDGEKYVKSVWSSWATIPEVKRRVPKYLIRSLCTLGLRPEAAKDSEYAYRQLSRILGSMCRSDAIGGCCGFALSYLQENKEAIVRDALLQWPMADIVGRFLFTANYVTELHGETGLGGSFRMLRFDEKTLSNSLAFAQRFGRGLDKISPASAAWLYNCLAYSYSYHVDRA